MTDSFGKTVHNCFLFFLTVHMMMSMFSMSMLVAMLPIMIVRMIMRVFVTVLVCNSQLMQFFMRIFLFCLCILCIHA